ncbi:hypothetical protein ACU4GD_17835 [Cupriavidus basilensis]
MSTLCATQLALNSRGGLDDMLCTNLVLGRHILFDQTAGLVGGLGMCAGRRNIGDQAGDLRGRRIGLRGTRASPAKRALANPIPRRQSAASASMLDHAAARIRPRLCSAIELTLSQDQVKIRRPPRHSLHAAVCRRGSEAHRFGQLIRARAVGSACCTTRQVLLGARYYPLHGHSISGTP